MEIERIEHIDFVSEHQTLESILMALPKTVDPNEITAKDIYFYSDIYNEPFCHGLSSISKIRITLPRPIEIVTKESMYHIFSNMNKPNLVIFATKLGINSKRESKGNIIDSLINNRFNFTPDDFREILEKIIF